MASLFSYITTDDDAGLRLDACLAQNKCFVSRSAAAKAIEEGRVELNGQQCSKSAVVSCGDSIVYSKPAEVETHLEGDPVPLDIRYEDNDLIVLSKQCGLVCHPSLDHESNTLVNALIHHCGVDHLCNVQGGDDRLGIVHRLDRDTTGLMLAAKSDESGLLLMEDIKCRKVDRHYLALVHGVISKDTGLIDAPLFRSSQDRMKMAVRDIPQARDAITSFSVIERFSSSGKDDGYTLIDCKLFTGRTHQIRVHMEFVKHPVVGDPVYSSHAPKALHADLDLERQFLHSYRIGFTHPITKEPFEFFDKLPRDLQDVLDSLKWRSEGVTSFGAEVLERLKYAPSPAVESIGI